MWCFGLNFLSTSLSFVMRKWRVALIITVSPALLLLARHLWQYQDCLTKIKTVPRWNRHVPSQPDGFAQLLCKCMCVEPAGEAPAQLQ